MKDGWGHVDKLEDWHSDLSKLSQRVVHDVMAESRGSTLASIWGGGQQVKQCLHEVHVVSPPPF